MNIITKRLPMILAGFINDSEARKLRIDASTHAIETISYEHHELHGGSAYSIGISTTDLGAETGDQLQFTFTTPNTAKWCHMLCNAYGSGEIYYTMREAPTGGMTGGTSVTPLNRNRNSSNVSILTDMKKGATAATGGTLLDEQYVGAGTNRIAGNTRGTQEWVLKANTIYAFRVYDTSAIQAYLHLDWYEHTDKD